MNVPGTKSAWKLLIAVSIVCGVAVFAAGFLHRQAVVDAVAKQQVRSAAVAKAMTNDVAGVNLTKQAKGADEKSLERSIDPPAGTDLVIFSLEGERVYATAGARAVAGDRRQVLDTAKGNVTRVVDGNDLVVYSAIPSEKKGNVAVAAVVTDYQKLLEDASGPLDGARMPLTALGLLLFVAGLVMFARERKGGGPKATVAPNTEKAEKVSKMPTFGKSKSAKVAKEPKPSKADKAPAKGRVSGFDPVP